MKEELQKKEQLKEAAKKRQEKRADEEAKQRILAKIEADKAERRAKAEREKAQREGRSIEPSPAVATTSTAPAAPKANAHTQARLRLMTSSGNIQKTFPAETTLFEVAHTLAQENSLTVSAFECTYPKKLFDTTDFGMTLKEAGLVPSAVLNVR